MNVRALPTSAFIVATIKEVETNSSNIIGIDFGTTNSSVAFASKGKVRIVQFPAAKGINHSSRSLLYLQRLMHVARKPVSVWTGAESIERYLATDSFNDEVQGRLIQYPNKTLPVQQIHPGLQAEV